MSSPRRPASRAARDFEHRPAMVAEVVDFLGTVPPGVVVDATVGGGGHAAALLAAHHHLGVLGLDRDPEAVAAATARLTPWGERVKVVRSRFDRALEVVRAEAAAGSRLGAPLVGAVFDLGVSSSQIDRPVRGFSYRSDGPLDMRMDPDQSVTAAQLVNTMSEAALVELLWANGEGRWSRAIARAVVRARPLVGTAQLAEVVAGAVPPGARRRGHPAARLFQALRIEVNQELDQLGPALSAMVRAVVPGGRVVILSYHSGEDRLVKAVLAQAASGGCSCPPGLPCVCGAKPWARVLTRGARMATKEEVAGNPRSASARLRAVERIDAPQTEPSP